MTNGIKDNRFKFRPCVERFHGMQHDIEATDTNHNGYVDADDTFKALRDLGSIAAGTPLKPDNPIVVDRVNLVGAKAALRQGQSPQDVIAQLYGVTLEPIHDPTDAQNSNTTQYRMLRLEASSSYRPPSIKGGHSDYIMTSTSFSIAGTISLPTKNLTPRSLSQAFALCLRVEDKYRPDVIFKRSDAKAIFALLEKTGLSYNDLVLGLMKFDPEAERVEVSLDSADQSKLFLLTEAYDYDTGKDLEFHAHGTLDPKQRTISKAQLGTTERRVDSF